MLNMDIKDRISLRLKDLDMTNAALAGKVGVSRATVTFWLRGDHGVKGDNLMKLAKALNCSPTWLQTGKGPAPDGLLTQANVEPGPDSKGMIPLISWVQAGSWCEVEDMYAVGDAEDWLPCPTSHGPRTYILRVRGESMFNPHARRSFRDGDLIYVDPDRVAENGSAVIAKLDDSQEATFKQLVIEGEDKYLKPMNPAWPEPIIKVTASASICGVVIGKYEIF